jgi:trigger factor
MGDTALNGGGLAIESGAAVHLQDARVTDNVAAGARGIWAASGGALTALDTAVTFDLPPSLVEMEAKQIAHQLWHDDNPDVKGHDHPDVETTDEHKSLAERRVRLGLLLAEVGKKQEIEVADQELQQAVFNEARKYPGQEREFFEFIQKNPQALQQFRAPLFEEKVVDFILELAQVTEYEVTKDELQKLLESLDEE